MNIKKFYKEHPVLSTFIFMILSSVVIICVITWLTHYITFHGKEYDLPDFTGFNMEQIDKFDREENIYDYKFVIIDSSFVPDKKGGIILTQDPAPNSKVKKGRKIYLSISAVSMPKIEMPNLVDLSFRQAENMLRSNDLKLGQVIYKASKFPNAVLEQRYKGRIIAAGSLIPYQSTITLIVGKEPLLGEELEDGDENGDDEDFSNL
ncbi:MAG: PASTA domain-containing protein [Bacteroidales bacterium]|jgi:beta-lactam-binding protein with PASTA domain|nr:PASTA domain-containing protein [Bacteroidales bacterium]